MNLFYLDEDIDINAQCHVDKHVPKMILEAAEMLCMAHWAPPNIPRKLSEGEYRATLADISEFKPWDPEQRAAVKLPPYVGRPAHLNHPCTIWVRSSLSNYQWTVDYMNALERERKYRFPSGVKEHRAITLCKNLPEPDGLLDHGITERPKAMKTFLDAYPKYNDASAMEAYRAFYVWDKKEFASYKNRDYPSWWKDYID